MANWCRKCIYLKPKLVKLAVEYYPRWLFCLKRLSKECISMENGRWTLLMLKLLRTGGQENFFHCNKCGCCYSTLLKNSHPCVEGAMHHDCPVCFEYLFESRNDVIVMPCGHTIHKSCLNEMREHYQFTCPLCSKSVCDMSKVWEKLDMEIAATSLPEPYQNKMVISFSLSDGCLYYAYALREGSGT